MKIHYLEIVSLDVDRTCAAYEKACNARFRAPDPVLGHARTAAMPDGSIVGVRAPMSTSEQPITRPYWLVDDIDQAVADVESAGAQIAHPALELPGKGKFAIYIQGGTQHGLWQL